MFIDRRLQVSTLQALTATAASTDVVDFGSDRDLGPGESLFVCIAVRVALAGTSPTINIAIQTDDNSGFSSAATKLTTETYTALPLGRLIVIPFSWDNERYVRLNYTLGGTSPTVTVDAWITNQAPQSWVALPDAI